MRTASLSKTYAPLVSQSSAVFQRAGAVTALTIRIATDWALRALRLLKGLRRTTAEMTSRTVRGARVHPAALTAAAANGLRRGSALVARLAKERASFVKPMVVGFASQASVAATRATRRARRLAKVTGPLMARRARRFARTTGPRVARVAMTMLTAGVAVALRAKQHALALPPHVRSAALVANRRLRRAAVVSGRSSRAVASLAVAYTRRSMVVAKPRLQRASLLASYNGKRVVHAIGRGLRKFAGTEVELDAFELDREDALLLEAQSRTALRAHPLPSFHEIQPLLDYRGATAGASAQPDNDADEITEVCTRAVVLSAKTSGGEARIECNPIGTAAPSLRPARIAEARTAR